jgi:hypothetical protein
MAYQVIFNNLSDCNVFHCKILEYLDVSRFTCNIFQKDTHKKLCFNTIRLKEKKVYCGNHPYSCAIANPGRIEPAHRKTKFLEGADWVGFNDMINDTLDELFITATVKSSACIVRKGLERCVKYTAFPGKEWDKEGKFKNCIASKRPITIFPKGTPGIPHWNTKNEENTTN